MGDGPEGDGPEARLRLEGLIARSVSAVLASSSGEMSELARLGVPRSAIRVIPYGVDTAEFVPSGPVARRNGRPRLLAVAPLTERSGLEVLVPDDADRAIVHEVIYRELVVGEVREASRTAYGEIIARMIERGAQAVILGCTEIMLLVRPEDSAVPLFDTTTLHAQAAVKRAFGGLR